MSGFPEPIVALIEQFGRLPGIGPKSAQRLAFHVIALPEDQVETLIAALREVKHGLSLCEQCCVITDVSPCAVCGDPLRERSVICVVQDTKDVVALERMRTYQGLYHVLGGAISPIDGVGPDQLHLRELFVRMADDQLKEVILATNSTIEGEATAQYIARLAHGFDGLDVTRIAHGLPVGGDLEYADEMTLARAFEFRRPL